MILDLFRLDGKVAIVTAAGRGIGAGIARAYAECGADVVIGARTEEQLAEVATYVESLGRKAIVVPGDLGSREGMAKLVDAAVSELGGVDIVVNNAGGTMPQAFMDTTEKAFDQARSAGTSRPPSTSRSWPCPTWSSAAAARSSTSPRVAGPSATVASPPTAPPRAPSSSSPATWPRTCPRRSG